MIAYLDGPNVYATDGPWADIYPYFALGSSGRCYPAIEGLKPGIGVMWGLLRGSPQLIVESMKLGQTWIYLDHGYFHRGHYDGHYRVTVNDFQQRELIERQDDRWKKLGVKLKPWKKGKNVVVCPPSDHVCRLFGMGNWEAETVTRLKELTDRPIVIRKKTDSRTFQVSIGNAHCVVTSSSLAAVEAAVLGVPVFVDETSAAAPIGLTDLAKIETPVYPDREPWAASLAYGQFTRDEMKDGTCWREIEQNLP
jgi:hypothetical protein